MLHNMLRASSIKEASITYITSATNNTSQQNYTFNLTGTFSSGLYVIGVAGESASAINRQIDGVELGGTAMESDVRAEVNTGAGGSLVAGIFRLVRTTTVTNPSFLVQFNGTMSRANIGLWIITRYNSDGAFYVRENVISGAASSISNTFTPPPTLPLGAVGVSILANGNFVSTTWTNATERYDNPFSSGTGASGADFTTTASGSRTITATASSGTNDGLVLVSAAWS